MDHLDFQQAIDYLGKKLSSEEANRISQHMKDCSQCQEEIQVAQTFLDGSKRFATPSPSLLNRVTIAFKRKQERQPKRTQQKANLQYDSWAQLVGSGVRGIPQERQLLFHEEEFDLDLQVMNDSKAKTYTMRGQMLGSFARDTANDLEGVSLKLRNKTNGQSRQGLTDQYGRFSFSQLDQSDYELFVELKERDIVINLESLAITG